MTTKVRIAGVQMDVQLAQLQANLEAMEQRFRTAVQDGAQLVVFPECVVTGYCYETMDEAMAIAESIPGPSTEVVSAWCGEMGAQVVFGMLEKDGPRLFNACVLIGPEGLIGKYRKTHLPSLGVDKLTTPGDSFFRRFRWRLAGGNAHLLRRCVPRSGADSLAEWG